MNRLETNNAIFRQDNAAIHTSQYTKDCLSQEQFVE